MGMRSARIGCRQSEQAEGLQVGVPSEARGTTMTTLATTLQMTFKPPLNELMHVSKRLCGIAVSEVVAPTTQVLVEFTDDLRGGLPALPRAGHFAYAITQASK